MWIKSVIALFMGLVIQLSQVQSCLAADAAKVAGTPSHSMSCCAGEKSCPCAKKSDPAQKPAPLIPVAPELKWLVSKTPEANNLVVRVAPPTDAVQIAAAERKAYRGFSGVRLSVAFCLFVI